MISHLARMIWLYERRKLHQSTLLYAMKAEISRLATGRHKLEGFDAHFRRLAPVTNEQFEQAHTAAQLLLDELRLRQSLREIEAARSKLAQLRAVAKTIVRFEEVLAARDQLLLDLQAPSVAGFATVKIFNHMIEKAEEMMATEQPRKTVFILRLCENEIRRWQQVETNDDRKKDLIERIEKARIVLSQTGDRESLDAISNIGELAGRGLVKLSEELLDDLITLYKRDERGKLFTKQIERSPDVTASGATNILKMLSQLAIRADSLRQRLDSSFED